MGSPYLDMPNPTRLILQPPTHVLDLLARAHFFISQEEDNDVDERRDGLGEELGILMTFCCIVWSVPGWEKAHGDALWMGLPKLSASELWELDELDDRSLDEATSEKKGLADEETEEDSEEEYEDLLHEYSRYRVSQIWRQYGDNLISEAVEGIEQADKAMAKTLTYCYDLYH
ncbi:hypothetical protein LTR85_002522 [Meristemomyces frigidus]|nr:hypothetical protein LTR85_002522 [Meristemomyces frigidus]